MNNEVQNIKEDEPVFLLRGADDEVYFIDDPALVSKLNAKVNELRGMAEDEITKYLLKIVNPEKYGEAI